MREHRASICEACPNILGPQVGKICKNCFGRFTVSEKAEDLFDRDPYAADDWLVRLFRNLPAYSIRDSGIAAPKSGCMAAIPDLSAVIRLNAWQTGATMYV